MKTQRLTGSVLLRDVLRGVVILVIIAYLTIFGLIMAERGQEGMPAAPAQAAVEALRGTVDYFLNHPAVYFWSKQVIPAPQLVATLLLRSAGLLLVAMVIAGVLGVWLGIRAANTRQRGRTPWAVPLSVLAISTPSFILAMLLWVGNIAVYRVTELRLPVVGFGWDAHMVMPALVLAAYPLAHLVQVTYVTTNDILTQDYVRTARSRGMSQRRVLLRHVLPNLWNPILTDLATSLRFSVAILPVVESFFAWPGAGLGLLQAMGLVETTTRQIPQPALVVDLILALGLLFLVVNGLLDLLYPRLDPRLRTPHLETALQAQLPWRARWARLREVLRTWWSEFTQRLPGRRPPPDTLRPLPVSGFTTGGVSSELPPSHTRHRIWRSLRNVSLILGVLLVAGLVYLVIAGDQVATASPYETHGIMQIDGELSSPPHAPSSVFPWGSDPVGRDVQALVLHGARQTLGLAFFGMLARLVTGAVLGALAGWWAGGWFDRFVRGATAVWVAFPVTLFAMILILAIGIQQGLWVFVLAMCIVGWTEIAQLVRSQVLSLRPQPFVEAARATGARSDHILVRHVLTALLPLFLILAPLEMAGVLMLLANLGFLDIFMGGGFRSAISEASFGVNVVFSFSDIPEWGALLANVRTWWRSYPWLGWFPGLAFTLSILAFNLLGEGLRRFIDEAHINVNRVINRYTVAGTAIVALSLWWLLQNTAPLNVYRDVAIQFDSERVMTDIAALSAPEMQGRETGTPGAQRAAEYVAARMAEIGLGWGGENDSYMQALASPQFHLTGIPRLELLDAQGQVEESFVYRQDMAEYGQQSGTGGSTGVPLTGTWGEITGPVVGLVTGPDPQNASTDRYSLGSMYLRDSVLLVRAEDAERINLSTAGGVLAVTDDPQLLQRRDLLTGSFRAVPVLWITPEVADRLLASTGVTWAELTAAAADLEPGGVYRTAEGAPVHIDIPGDNSEDISEKYYNVIGYVPGTASEQGLDSQVILVSAYLDGVGTSPGGTLYPGANDNASGVATLLEVARIVKNSPFPPKKTVMFVVWNGAERHESLSLVKTMAGRLGFNLYDVEAVLEISGTGAGSGEAVALDPDSSYRLVRLLQNAGSRLGIPTTTRGRDPHFGLRVLPSVGGRKALTAYVSWDGADATAHLPEDSVANIDPQKLSLTGRLVTLVTTFLSRETNY
jgi:peptide/nickel transport system permease protein